MDIINLEERIKKAKALLVYFFNPGCVACKSLQPKVWELASVKFPELEFLSIDASINPSITARAGVYSAPGILVFFEGKEYIRESKYISVGQLEEKILRYYDMVFS
ncbi:MAG: thioredoxin family protein [Bacteroidales bacterium]|nr:thioredoxin family protein [Bacteroidales bacterium]